METGMENPFEATARRCREAFAAKVGALEVSDDSESCWLAVEVACETALREVVPEGRDLLMLAASAPQVMGQPVYVSDYAGPFGTLIRESVIGLLSKGMAADRADAFALLDPAPRPGM
jgi:hypothetical protein